jgi:hypothetical protein
MAISHLGLEGPQAAYGIFLPKEEGAPPEIPFTAITQLGLHGPQAAYGTFLPKHPIGHQVPVTDVTIYASRVTDLIIYASPTEEV